MTGEVVHGGGIQSTQLIRAASWEKFDWLSIGGGQGEKGLVFLLQRLVMDGHGSSWMVMEVHVWMDGCSPPLMGFHAAALTAGVRSSQHTNPIS